MSVDEGKRTRSRSGNTLEKAVRGSRLNLNKNLPERE
jgi:hypothetical protein